MPHDETTPQGAGTAWSWPAYAPWESLDAARDTVEGWAPSSTVRHPWLRLGRWTLLYRRAAP